MVTFTDKFNRSDRVLHDDNGWEVINSAGGESGISIVNEYAENLGHSQATQSGAGNVPTTTDQEVSAWMTSTAQATDNIIDIGVAGKHHATVYATREFSIFCRMSWLADGERKLEILHQLGSESATTTLATLTMVAAGSVVQTGYFGRLLDDGAVNSLQHVRMIVTAADYGTKVSVFVNQEDDAEPTLEAKLRSDFIGPDEPTDFGDFWFAFGPAVVSTLKIAEFSGADYALADRKPSALRDEPTLAELRELVKKTFSGGTNSNLVDQDVEEIIIGEVEGILNELGDQAWFLIRQEVSTLTRDDDGFSTLPRYIERLLSLERQGQRRPANWQFDHYAANGDVVIRLDVEREPTGETYIMRYVQRWERMGVPDDVCPIPRQYKMAVVYAACRILAKTRERDPMLEAGYEQLRVERLGQIIRNMSRLQRGIKARYQPRRMAIAGPFGSLARRY